MKKKLIIIILSLLLFINFNNNIVLADGITDIINSGKNFMQRGNVQIDSTQIQPLSNTIYNILFALGLGIAVIIAAVLGIKFILGSAEEKADIKGMLIPYIVGCAVIFGAFGIWKAIVDIMQSTGI